MNVQKEEFTIRRYQNDLAEDLQFLFNRVFKRNVTKEYLYQKYDVEKFGAESVATIAYFEDHPVAFYGAIPFPALYHGKKIWVAHACDSITLPEFQRKGLHGKLANASYEIMKELGITFVFAMHSKATFRATRKLNWLEQEHMARFHLSTGKLGLNKLFERLPGLLPPYHRYIERVLSPYLVDRTSFKNGLNENEFSVLYTPEFLDYKNFSPNYVIRTETCMIWLKVAGVLCVGATFGLTKNNISEVMEFLEELGKKLLVKEVMFHVSRGTAEYDLLSTKLKEFDSWLIGYLSFDTSINVNEFKLNYADLDTF